MKTTTATTTKTRTAAPKAPKPARETRPAARRAAKKHALYFAYGANTNLDSMATRCPDAEAVGSMTLRDHRLVFRGVADVIRDKGRTVFGALWWITPRCERALDAFEGFPHLYVKRYGKVQVDGEEHVVMFYVMRDEERALAPPYLGYEQTLREGYRDFELPQEQIDLAIEEGPSLTARFDKLRRLAA